MGKTIRTNFENGGWDSTCPHCGEMQSLHRKSYGPDDDGNVYEHRLPCESELKQIKRKHRSLILAGKCIVFALVIAVPLVLLIVFQLSPLLGWLAFGYGVFKLGIVAIKHYGNPHKWIPGYTEKKKREDLHAHYIYHCERNTDGFERLKLENFRKWESE